MGHRTAHEAAREVRPRAERLVAWAVVRAVKPIEHMPCSAGGSPLQSPTAELRAAAGSAHDCEPAPLFPREPARAELTRTLVELRPRVVDVVGCDDDLHAAECRVREVYVDVRIGELAGELAEGAGPVLDVDHEDLTLVGDPHGGVLEGVACPCHVSVVDEEVDDAAPLAGEGRKTPNVHAAATERFAEPCELARAVIQDHGEISRHRGAFEPGQNNSRFKPPCSDLWMPPRRSQTSQCAASAGCARCGWRLAQSAGSTTPAGSRREPATVVGDLVKD